MSKRSYAQHIAGAVIDDDTDEQLKYRYLVKKDKCRDTWIKSLENELGRLAQGIRDIKGTDTISFVHKSEIPKDRLKEVTYGRIFVAYKPNKSEPHISRLTVGGDRIVFLYNVRTPTADLPTIKMLWNSVLSTPGARYMTLDISNFYLGTPMDRPEYMRLPLKLILQDILDKYKLNDIADNGWVYLKIVKGMYGLPQSGKLAHDLLKKRLGEAG